MANQVVINKRRRLSKDELAVNIVGVVLIGIFALICVIPFYLIIIASFTSETSLIRTRKLLSRRDHEVP